MTRYKVKVNRAGLIFIAVTILLGVSAVNTGNNLLYMVVSSMLSFMLLSGLTSLYNLKGLSVILLPPKEVFAKRVETFRVILENTHRLPKFLISLESPHGRTVLPLLVKKAEVSLPMLFEKRGLYEEVIITVKTDFPVGLFSRYYQQVIKTRVVVFPEPIPANISLFRGEEEQKAWESGKAAKVRGYEDISGIRDYAGEPIKLIHWKASAKLAKLMVKEMQASTRTPVMLDLNSFDGDLETRLSKLTYSAIRLLEEGFPVGLYLEDEVIPPAVGEAQRLKILTALALFHQSPGVRA